MSTPANQPNPPEQEESRKRSEKSCLSRFGTCIYNRQKGEFLGRNCGSWGRICLFYIVFYIFLFTFFFAFIFILYLFLPATHPMLTGTEGGLISDQPGAGVIPLIKGSSLVYIGGTSDPKIKENFVEPLQKLVDGTRRFNHNFQKCELGQKRNASFPGCSFDSEFGHCTKENNFGYDTLQPCVALRLNKIIDWKPSSLFMDGKKKITSGELKTALEGKDKKLLPQTLIRYIKEKSASLDGDKLEDFLSSVWFNCDGDLARDKEFMGPIAYYPGPLIDNHFYPYRRSEDPNKQPPYPFIMVQFLRPLLNVPISITCKAYSKGLRHEPNEGVGTVRFQLFLSDK